ncbi:MAG: hypothetical protein ACSLEN_02935 [Candidatus Malihini olakiniferum]
MSKRYGFIYVDLDDTFSSSGDRYKKNPSHGIKRSLLPTTRMSPSENGVKKRLSINGKR